MCSKQRGLLFTSASKLSVNPCDRDPDVTSRYLFLLAITKQLSRDFKFKETQKTLRYNHISRVKYEDACSWEGGERDVMAIARHNNNCTFLVSYCTCTFWLRLRPSVIWSAAYSWETGVVECSLTDLTFFCAWVWALVWLQVLSISVFSGSNSGGLKYRNGHYYYCPNWNNNG